MPVVVLGMHRSGTSAVTRALSLLGLPVGDEAQLIPAMPENARGFWESRTLTVFNDRLLATLGGAWDRPPALEPGWPAQLAGAQDAARSALAGMFGDTAEWIWKDPRNSLLLPFWRDVLPARPVAVLVQRNPLEVWRSLERRNGTSKSVALALWERYSREALRQAADLPTLVVSYDEFMGDPATFVKQAEVFLRDHGVAVGDGDAEAAAAFADPALRHAVAGRDALAGDPDVSAAQLALYDLLGEVRGGHADGVTAELPPPTAWAEALLAERVRPAPAPTPAEPAAAHAKPASIVFVSQNQAAGLARTLQAVVAHTPEDLYEAVLVDDASDDDTTQLLAAVEGDVRVIVNGERDGLVRARNQGALASRADVVVFVAPGLEPQAGWLKQLLDEFDDAGVGAAGGRVVGADGATWEAGLHVDVDGEDIALRTRRSAESADVDALGPGLLAVRREALAAAGGFDEEQPFDLAAVQLSLRLRAAGWRLRCRADVVARAQPPVD